MRENLGRKAEKMPATNPSVIIAYFLGILGLTGFAIYDLHAIIKDFVEDNRITVIKPVNITDRIPFLQELQVCVYHTERPVFPGRPVTHEQLISMAREYWLRGWNSSWNDNADFDKELFEHYGKAALDDYTIYEIGAAMENFENEDVDSFGAAAMAHSMSKADLMRSWDTFLTAPNSVERSKEAWKAMQWLIVGRVGDQIATSYFSWCYGSAGRFSISLQDDTHLLQRRLLKYSYDYPNFVNETKNLTTTRVKLALPGETILINKGPTDMTTATTVCVYNTAIFSRANFPPCTDSFQTERDCLYDLKMKAVSDICGCAIFTEILKKVINRNETRNDNKKFCTTAVLEKCAKKAFFEARKRQDAAKKDGICRPCSVPKNSYSVTETISPMANDSRHRSTITIVCPDTAYILFEDKPQFCWSQMVSQVGGDLGLYMGFSMITVLQAILISYQYCMRCGHRRGASGTHQTRDAKQWFHTIMQHMAENARLSTKKIESENRDCKHRSCFEDRLELLLKHQAEFEQKMERLVEEIRHGRTLAMPEPKKSEH